MPSLNALGEFKSSFSNIAGEKKDILSKNLPFDDLPLPDTEAAPMDFSSQAPPSGSGGNDAPAADSGDGFDFGAFLDSLPEDVNPEHLDEPPSFDDLIQDANAPPSGVGDLFQDTALPPLDDIPGSDSPPVSEEETTANFDLPPDMPIDALTDTPADVSTDVSADTPIDISTDDAPADTPLGEDDFSIPDGLMSDLPGEAEPVSADTGFEDLGDLGSEEPGAGDTGSEESNNAADLEGESSNVDVGSENSEELPDEVLGTDDFFKDFDIPETPSSEDAPIPEDALSEEDMPVSEDSLLEEDVPAAEKDISLSEDQPSLEDAPSPDIADTFDLGDSIDLSGETPEAGGKEAGGDFSLDTAGLESPLPDADFSGIGETAQDDSGFESPLPDTDFSGADLDAGFESPLPDTDFSGADETAQDDSGFESPLPDTDFSGFDMGGEEAVAPEDGESAGAAGLGDLASDFESESIELDSEPEETLGTSGGSFGGDAAANDDFALPGLEEIFDKTKTQTVAPPAPKKKLFGRKKAAAGNELPEAEENIEEIQLSQEQLEKILRTLSTYPMNLKIACEEMIAEQVLLPKQLSRLLNLLVSGAGFREAAGFAEEVLKRQIVIPKSFEKMTGAAFEAEQASFAYIFVHNFLPVLRLFAVIAAFAASVLYLGYKFIYIPVKAESIYKRGYECIPAGEYQRANQLFNEAFATHQKKKWFYLYAESFRDQRRYLLAEEKYDELLRYYPRDKKGVLDYAHLETYNMLNYDKANRLLQQQLIDYAPNDYDGLLAAGDNFLAWADSDPDRFYDKYEDARFSYARLLETYGWLTPVVERMMKYFIRTDNLREVLYLRVWFENDSRRKLTPESLAELGGYLLDKQLEKPDGVPNPFIESIESVRAMLLQAIREEPTLPEPHYHLARYHNSLGNTYEERLTLENAIRAFDLAQTETVRRRLYRVDAHYRYSNLLVNSKEFFPAEEQIIRGIQLYEDFLSRNLIRATPQLGQLYAAKGDLEYFVKSGDMNAALNDYRLAERYGYSPPEIQYRMGAAYYQLENWGSALDYLFRASAELPLNRRLLYALGNVTYQRGDYFAAQGYYNRLLDILENQRVRLPVLLPNDNPQFLELGERLMMARNNAGVVYEALAGQTGNREYRSRALALYAESARAWDAITRNPETMIRMRITDSPGSPGINLGYLNANNALRPVSNLSPEIFVRIDKDADEPSRWEELAPFGGL